MSQLSAQLRERTRDAHEQMEQTLDLLRPGFGRDDYARLVSRWYGFFAVWEPVSFGVFPDAMAVYLDARRKLPMLRADLEGLGIDTGPLPRVDPTSLDWMTPASALGTLYVVEGSTLGGQVIVKKVQERLGLQSAYFASYGPETGRRWQETKRLLDEPPFAADPTTVADAASRTFDFLAGWLK